MSQKKWVHPCPGPIRAEVPSSGGGPAHCMPPVDVRVIKPQPGGIVLGEEVIFSPVVEQSVDVAHAAFLVGEVELGTIGLVTGPA